MRRRVRERLRAAIARRRRYSWTVREVTLTCFVYFGGALAVSSVIGSGWWLFAWLVLGLSLVVAQGREPAL